MEFPITRKRLQTITQEVEKDAIDKRITQLVEGYKREIISQAYTDSLYTPSVWNQPPRDMFRKLKLNISEYAQVQNRNISMKEYFPEIISKLQTLFPDVSFQVDPLKTYLLVDWS